MCSPTTWMRPVMRWLLKMRQSQCNTPVRQLPPWLKMTTWTISCQRRAQTSGLTHGSFQRHARIKRVRRNFLNYICGDEPAQLNFEYVYYASPIQSVIDNQDEETKENEAINPPSDMLKTVKVYRALNDDDATLYNTLWQRLKSD